MSKIRIRQAIVRSGLLLFLASAVRVMGQSDGLYADFTTSLGSFTCQLDYTNAPKAVANFIGLATGQRAWLDEAGGWVRTNNFYNGLTFHRVIADFMIQGGSPNGLGTDGPGYAFVDEFSPSLTFTNFGMLAMANSGTNSNGAQFFVTAAATPWLNNVHTIFGKLTVGSNVVYAISRVATDASNKPLTNVVIQQVAIRRVGTAAQAFNIQAQGLPIVTNLPLQIAKGSNQVSLTFSNRLYADNRLYAATDITGSWTANALGIEISSPYTNQVFRANDAPRRFFRMVQVQYAASTLAPKTLYGRNLALTLITGGPGTITISFDSAGGGTYSFPPYSPGVVQGYYWTQEPYRASLLIGLSGLPVLSVRCDFAAGTIGRFAGTAYPNYPYDIGAFPVDGTFTLTGP